jgi:hypothetical protein
MGQKMTGQIMAKSSDEVAHADALYSSYLVRLNEAPVVVIEPRNGGPRLAQFVEVISGMGERAAKRGTIARSVRERQAKK